MTSSQRWFRFFPSDWLSITGGLSPAERGVLFSLVCLMFDRGEPLAREDARLARQCGMPTTGFRKAVAVLIDDGKLIERDGALWSDWVEMEHKISSEKAMAASRSAQARWSKNGSKINGATNAVALRGQSGRNATQNQNIPPTPNGGDLLIVREGDPLVPLLAKVRGKEILFGTRGTVTATSAEIEAAKALAGAA